MFTELMASSLARAVIERATKTLILPANIASTATARMLSTPNATEVPVQLLFRLRKPPVAASVP